MKKKYKEFVVRNLYGLMEGSAKDLERSMRDGFNTTFGFKPDNINVTYTHRFIEEEYMNGCWIGSMTAYLSVNGSEYVLTKDWGEEYDIDKHHPDYESDNWFYESEKCESYKRCKELLKNL